MGIILAIAGILIGAFGLLAFLGTMANPMANISAILICVLGAILFGFGTLLIALANHGREVIAAIQNANKV